MLRRRRGIRAAAALAIAVALAGPVASAGAAGLSGAGRSGLMEWPGLDRLWVWVRAALTPEKVTAADCDRGAGLDPNGHCVHQDPTPPPAGSSGSGGHNG